MRAEHDAELEYRLARREVADFYMILPEKSRFWRLVFEGPNFILLEWMNKTCNGIEILRQTFLNYVFYGTDKLDWFQDDDYKQLIWQLIVPGRLLNTSAIGCWRLLFYFVRFV